MMYGYHANTNLVPAPPLLLSVPPPNFIDNTGSINYSHVDNSTTIPPPSYPVPNFQSYPPPALSSAPTYDPIKQINFVDTSLPPPIPNLCNSNQSYNNTSGYAYTNTNGYGYNSCPSSHSDNYYINNSVINLCDTSKPINGVHNTVSASLYRKDNHKINSYTRVRMNKYASVSKNETKGLPLCSSMKEKKICDRSELFIRECVSGFKSEERLEREKDIECIVNKDKVSERVGRGGFVKFNKTVNFKKNFKQRANFTLNGTKSRLKNWRWNNCSNKKEWQEKMEKLSTMDVQDLVRLEEKKFTRTSPAEMYYTNQVLNSKVLHGTQLSIDLSKKFVKELIERSDKYKAIQAELELPPLKRKLNLHVETDSDDESDEKDRNSNDGNEALAELERKQQHPRRLHPDLWYNGKGELNDGPLCRCSAKSKKFGIRHNMYEGEEDSLPKCEPNSNNSDKLYHYRITISPPTNFLINTPTIIKYDDHEFIFEGFSMLSHFPLPQLPACKIIRFNLSYTILYIEEKIPDNFTIKELDIFYEYFFNEILELVDFDLHPPNVSENERSCPIFHFMPRFVRDLPDDNCREILSMCQVLKYLLKSSDVLIQQSSLLDIQAMPNENWEKFVSGLKGTIVTKPGMKPCAIRIDQLDRNISSHPENLFPDIVHFGIKPPQLSYAGDKKYQRLWRSYIKSRHLLANMPKPSSEDKQKLQNKEIELQKMRCEKKYRRGVTAVICSEGFYRTGVSCDMVQHALLVPVLVSHLRFHRSLNSLEERIDYKFKNRLLLQLALTHPSYRENYGTNPDHVRNILTNLGIRQPEYGDRHVHYEHTRKRGINTLINIMAKFGNATEQQSKIMNNERLEFLGDAVIEFITSIHLFHLFPEIEEGGLATYRAAIVQNQHLTKLAENLKLHHYMLFAHGSDLCHDLELRHAMANCFEALMGALCLDGDIQIADRIFSKTYFHDNDEMLQVWNEYPPHPLQEQEPDGDRKWIKSFPMLEKLTEFEEKIGVTFKHIRLLARAFTDRSVGYTNLTLGSNQRMEFLGDTILQLICSLYLYKHFPDHHEGHLSLLRSSLVNNRTQSVVCDDLGLSYYAAYSNPKDLLKVKDRADLLEAFIGALYIDKGLKYCEEFCDVCFFPRLQFFIMRQDWNDPKSKLQQCCLTLRSIGGEEPDIPVYKVIECKGPTNGRTYGVAVYFKKKRLAEATGHNIQQAEMNAASKALENSKELFPHLEYQKRAIYKSIRSIENEGSSVLK